MRRRNRFGSGVGGTSEVQCSGWRAKTRQALADCYGIDVV